MSAEHPLICGSGEPGGSVPLHDSILLSRLMNSSDGLAGELSVGGAAIELSVDIINRIKTALQVAVGAKMQLIPDCRDVECSIAQVAL